MRENSNEITIKMRGYPVWGLVSGTLYHFGEITFERGTRKKYRRNHNRSFRDVDVYRLQIVILRMIDTDRWTKLRHTSDWMPGKPFDINNKNPIPPPIFRTLKENDLPWSLANKTPLSIQIPGKVASSNEWQIAKVYLPCNYYALFPDFQLAFINCVNETIATMLKDGNAHAEVYETPKFMLPPYSEFYGDVVAPTSTWFFLEDFQRTTSICLISVAKKFRDMVDFQIVLNPKLEWQLGLIDEPHRLGAIPFSERKLQSTERKFSTAVTIPRSTFDVMRSLLRETLKPRPASGREVTWRKRTTTVDPYNFYGIKSIDLGRNAITSLWIFCDVVDTSYVGNVQIPLLQLVPAVTVNSVASFERFGMLYRKRINKGRVNTIKIWITETFDGKPIRFREPVIISLEVQRDA